MVGSDQKGSDPTGSATLNSTGWRSDLMVEVCGPGEGGDGCGSFQEGGGGEDGQQLLPVPPPHHVQRPVRAVLTPPPATTTHTALLNTAWTHIGVGNNSR